MKATEYTSPNLLAFIRTYIAIDVISLYSLRSFKIKTVIKAIHFSDLIPWLRRDYMYITIKRYITS